MFVAPLLSFTLAGWDEFAGSLLTIVFYTSVALLVYSLGDQASLGLLNAVVCVALAQAVFGVIQGSTDAFPGWGTLGESGRSTVGVNELAPHLWAARSVGTMAHPIPLGMLCALALTIVATQRLKRWDFLRIVSASLLVVGILVSGSRSAALAAAAGVSLTVAIAASKSMRLGSRVGAGVLFVAVVSIALTGVVMAFDIAQSLTQSFSLMHRQRSLSSFWTLWDRPLVQVALGSGPHGVADTIARGYLIDDGFDAVDNAYVWSFVTGGILHLGLFVWLLYGGFARIVSPGSQLAAVLIVASFTFDLLAWNSFTVLFVVAMGGAWFRPEARLVSPPAGTS